MELTLTADDIAEGRAWLTDCAWADIDSEAIACLPDAVVVRAVGRHCEGGWAALLEVA